MATSSHFNRHSHTKLTLDMDRPLQYTVCNPSTGLNPTCVVPMASPQHAQQVWTTRAWQGKQQVGPTRPQSGPLDVRALVQVYSQKTTVWSSNHYNRTTHWLQAKLSILKGSCVCIICRPLPAIVPLPLSQGSRSYDNNPHPTHKPSLSSSTLH